MDAGKRRCASSVRLNGGDGPEMEGRFGPCSQRHPGGVAHPGAGMRAVQRPGWLMASGDERGGGAAAPYLGPRGM